MKALTDVTDFGGTDADNDDILLQAFEDHEAYLDVMALRRHMIVGKKGSGKQRFSRKSSRLGRTTISPMDTRSRTTLGTTTNCRHVLEFPTSTNTRTAGNTSFCCP